MSDMRKYNRPLIRFLTAAKNQNVKSPPPSAAVSPSWSYLARGDGFFSWIFSNSSPVPAFSSCSCIYFQYTTSEPFNLLTVPNRSYIVHRQGHSVDPQKICVAYALHHVSLTCCHTVHDKASGSKK